jgi:hypothetical protein
VRISVVAFVCFCSSFWRSQNLRRCLCLFLFVILAQPFEVVILAQPPRVVILAKPESPYLSFLFVIPAGNLLLFLSLLLLLFLR